jgi:branched-chain amino acid transport system ATP-binding protein
MLLSIEDASVHYQKAAALKNVSLKVDERSIVTIIGANGAGKSTMLRAISGLVRLSYGAIWFDGASSISSRPTTSAVTPSQNVVTKVLTKA